MISIAAGVVSTLSGGTPGFLDGKASQARFNDPAQIAVDGTGQVYVADRDNHRIRLISGGIVSTVAGSVTGFLDGPRLKARFSGPVSVALPTANPLEFYVADGANRRIRKVSFK